MELSQAQDLALSLMAQHNLEMTGPYAWRFRFDNARLRFGSCNRSLATITLSRYLTLLNDEHHVRQTILHEIAHALSPRGSGHNHEWRKIARAIGDDGARCYAREVIKPKASYRGTCPGCRRTIERFKRLKIACGKCSHGVFNALFVFTWEKNND